jgi:hypothetical protein
MNSDAFNIIPNYEIRTTSDKNLDRIRDVMLDEEKTGDSIPLDAS